MADKNDEKTVVTPEAAEAKAEKGAKAPKVTGAHKGADAALPTPAWVCIAVAALVVGVLCGHFLLGGGSSISLSGKTTLTGDQLDSTIATYTYNGKTVDVTARQVISQSKSVDSAANSEGTYDVPVADDALYSMLRAPAFHKARVSQRFLAADAVLIVRGDNVRAA